MIIREAKPVDASSISRVVVDTWRTTYVGIVPQDYLDSMSYERFGSVWQDRISNTNKIWSGWFIYVAHDDYDNVVGFAGGGPKQNSDLPFSGELGFIYLLKSYQRRGTGRRLAATVALRLKEQGHKSMLVWVFTANPYRAFYEALGGKPVSERFVDAYRGHLAETAYGWENLDEFEQFLESGSTP